MTIGCGPYERIPPFVGIHVMHSRAILNQQRDNIFLARLCGVHQCGILVLDPFVHLGA
eukprot:CAMPEP_0184698944 /NCGR_PEP_ID=MMETSP0313-20130426/5384_1 /TAXON_ID=2792 /ORGANISM="Porphyridium aerugineum, Strain SAG 1380-2" /LENGTH=57 /DNA_ID=CAMNT_0027157951 /DNA_START=280 /DNA_END=449 /DNA_ORIENTATION=-